MLIYIYDTINQRLHNKLSIWMDDLISVVYRDVRHINITHWCWPAEERHPMRWTGHHLRTESIWLTLAEATACTRSSCFWGKQRKSHNATGHWPPLQSRRIPVIGFPLQSTSLSLKKPLHLPPPILLLRKQKTTFSQRTFIKKETNIFLS